MACVKTYEIPIDVSLRHIEIRKGTLKLKEYLYDIDLKTHPERQDFYEVLKEKLERLDSLSLLAKLYWLIGWEKYESLYNQICDDIEKDNTRELDEKKCQ